MYIDWRLSGRIFIPLGQAGPDIPITAGCYCLSEGGLPILITRPRS